MSSRVRRYGVDNCHIGERNNVAFSQILGMAIRRSLLPQIQSEDQQVGRRRGENGRESTQTNLIPGKNTLVRSTIVDEPEGW